MRRKVAFRSTILCIVVWLSIRDGWGQPRLQHWCAAELDPACGCSLFSNGTSQRPYVENHIVSSDSRGIVIPARSLRTTGFTLALQLDIHDRLWSNAEEEGVLTGNQSLACVAIPFD